jgi:putative iron-regulated protein
MIKRRKTWLGIGVSVVAGTTATLAAATSAPPETGSIDGLVSGERQSAPAPSPVLILAQAPAPRLQGGEGSGKGVVPQSYALPDATVVYNATKEIEAYAKGVHATYAAAAADARKLQAAVNALLAKPSAATLAAARAAWTAARPSYLQSEAFRFYDGPIEGIEGEINSWPVNEAFIDYVKDAPKSGIINDPTIEVSTITLIVKNQVSDEADVTLGWHAIEFLLWGQDFSATGPGNRLATDYTPGSGNNDRRRAYLKAATDRMVEDLDNLVTAWKPGLPGNYAARFLALDPKDAVGRMMTGAGALTGNELMSQRMSVGLDSGDQEDEHSCFSDTTYQDFIYDLKGVENVWTGKYPGAAGAGMRDLVRRVDPGIAGEIDLLLADATAKIAALPRPWDQVLASAPGSAGRIKGEAAVSALGALAQGLKRAGTRLGVLVQIPG